MPKIIFQPLMIANPLGRLTEDNCKSAGTPDGCKSAGTPHGRQTPDGIRA